MDLHLRRTDRDLQQRSRDFTEQVLIPLEDECEENDGLTPASVLVRRSGLEDVFLHLTGRTLVD